ncbi:unnamed protein product [Cladocopium goreaui]|uniref:Uncharacterized protein n=1 Tax=Cladocopium goreaui TaxID=2562237 RepID=A0A9P1C6M0_9DINO|nr:unnamed protein product [Cladocopium goreaui]
MAHGRFSTRQVWNSANELVQAYSIGRSEAAAALNLLNSVAPSVCEELSNLVKQHSMQKFLTHEAIAAGVFNEGTCCATSSQSEWADVLTVNRQNLTWLIQRMSSDFNSQHTKMRKPWSSKELEPLQRACCAFVASCVAFRSKYPSDFVKTEMPAINKGFLLRHGDAEILAMMDDSAPPIDLMRIGLFRVAIMKFQKKARAKTVCPKSFL